MRASPGKRGKLQHWEGAREAQQGHLHTPDLLLVPASQELGQPQVVTAGNEGSAHLHSQQEHREGKFMIPPFQIPVPLPLKQIGLQIWINLTSHHPS